jgi:glycosyltransferase involved in cell wall biosynthesis
MRVLYHNPNSEGGLSEYAVHQGRAIAEVKGVELLWQSPKTVPHPERAHVLAVLPTPVVRAGRPRWRRAWDFFSWVLTVNRALDRAIAELRPDAVMLPAWSEYFAPLWAWRLRRWRRQGVRFGALIHDPVRDFQRGGSWFHRLSLRNAYSFLDVAFVHDSVDLDTAGAPQPRLVVVPLGPYRVPLGDAAPFDLRRELAIPQNARVLLSFGHIRDGKCLDAVLEAMVTCPDCHLIVAGREQSAGQKPAAHYQDLAQRLGITDRCHWFLGYIPNDEVWRYFRASDLLLLLYSRDFHSMSAVLNVNVQFRLPVLASAGGGPLLKAVQRYRLGQILEDTQPETIAKALAKDELPAARWDDYLRDHSWETNARRVVDALSCTSELP